MGTTAPCQRQGAVGRPGQEPGARPDVRDRAWNDGRVLLSDHFPPVLPAGLASRLPVEDDVAPLAALLTADRRTHSPGAEVSEDALRSHLVGLRSWARRQVVVVPAAADGSATAAAPVAWIAIEDRAAGRSDVQWAVSRDLPGRDDVAVALLDWAAEAGGSFARHRGVDATQLDATANALDTDRARLLTAAGYAHVRTWLHMRRPVDPAEATGLPAPRDSTRVRRVHLHPSGLPVAQDVTTVHRMLEESFADHWGSYRESFAEFVQRLVEDPQEADWDHWWIAEIEREGSWLPAGGLVAARQAPRGDLGEGTYLEYLGVHRSARGHGVAKSLLRAAFADAAARGRARVELEVDADSPTGADGLYEAMGFTTFERTQTWHATAPSHPSRLLEPPA